MPEKVAHCDWCKAETHPKGLLKLSIPRHAHQGRLGFCSWPCLAKFSAAMIGGQFTDPVDLTRDGTQDSKIDLSISQEGETQ